MTQSTSEKDTAATRSPIYGTDYDGWALPLKRLGGPLYYSHFVGSSRKPGLPKGCVRVKISEVSDVVLVLS